MGPPRRWVREGFGRVVDGILDRSVVLSLDKRGFARHARHFDADDLDVDLAGRVALVTGASSAIGETACEALARRGATVLMGCRDRDRGMSAVKEVRALSGSRDVRLVDLDVTDFEAVDTLRPRLGVSHIDVLLHSAGNPPGAREERDRDRRSLMTQVVGPLRLTHRLLPLLGASREARVVFVSPPRARARQTQLIVAERLARELEATPISVHVMHPGWTDTPAGRAGRPRLFALAKSILRTPEEGADTLVWLACAERLPRGVAPFWIDRRSAKKPRLGPYLERERVWRDACHWAGVDWSASPRG